MSSGYHGKKINKFNKVFHITATGRPYSEPVLPTTKLEIHPCFTEYFI